ncbi:hypothetical protein C1645_813288 [Glomus cerebriforme]|uniref:Uncharacterized protein n=1 Tax=Glomus cerebriforme TaxID=658196 RepID=A0A397TNK3_9GLOM|nr:hypothetical protein C1645_813288 [Glomus cerebriforme]
MQDLRFNPIIDEFLNRINHEKIYELPYDNNPLMVATRARNCSTTIKKLTGQSLLKWNVKLEAQRLKINNNYIINLSTEYIWNFYLSDSQRDRFISLANNVNDINRHVSMINNTDTINRIFRLDQQKSNNPFVENFFNGTPFY